MTSRHRWSVTKQTRRRGAPFSLSSNVKSSLIRACTTLEEGADQIGELGLPMLVLVGGSAAFSLATSGGGGSSDLRRQPVRRVAIVGGTTATSLSRVLRAPLLHMRERTAGRYNAMCSTVVLCDCNSIASDEIIDVQDVKKDSLLSAKRSGRKVKPRALLSLSVSRPVSVTSFWV